MGFYSVSSEGTLYHRLPKVDLHRHLEGTLRLNTMMDIARDHGITLPMRPSLRSMVQMQPEDTLNFVTFLSKFQVLRLFYRSPEVISRIAEEAIADAAADGVVYLELRFTPVALSRAQGYSLAEVMDWVCDSTAQAARVHGVQIGLIASVNRHESPDLAEQVAGLAVDRLSKGVVALDLAGNEAEFSAAPFAGIFRQARMDGLGITVHAGEWSGPESVRQAILDLQADRIGHGVRVLEDPDVTALAVERRTPFEVCITSNYQTGVVPALSAHPLVRMINAGLNTTLNTDDPSISQITLSDEYQRACEDLGLTREILQERILAAAQAAFLPAAARQQLVERLQAGFQEV